MATVDDVAAAIIERAPTDIDPMQLQKLLYYVQGWSQAWRSTPMFDEEIQAWRYGPVVRRVWVTYNDHGARKIQESRSGDAAALSSDEVETIAAVLDRYGAVSGWKMSLLTHEDDAWIDAWDRRTGDDRGNEPIEPAAIARSLRRAPCFGDPAIADAGDLDENTLRLAREGDSEAWTALLQGVGATIDQ